jgi:hypothetical protein
MPVGSSPFQTSGPLLLKPAHLLTATPNICWNPTSENSGHGTEPMLSEPGDRGLQKVISKC